jgi:hypothetical protein
MFYGLRPTSLHPVVEHHSTSSNATSINKLHHDEALYPWPKVRGFTALSGKKATVARTTMQTIEE